MLALGWQKEQAIPVENGPRAERLIQDMLRDGGSTGTSRWGEIIFGARAA